jgi:hypothetical protein
MVLSGYKIFILLFHLIASPVISVADKDDSALHPFYVSVTEINHNEKDKSLEITCKIFTDDMENVLKQNFKTTVDLSDQKQKEKNDKLITAYIKKNLNIAADKKSVQLNYVGYEKDSEAVFCYFEIINISTVKELDVSNSILQDLTEDQINIMHVFVNGIRKSYKLGYPDKLARFTF